MSWTSGDEPSDSILVGNSGPKVQTSLDTGVVREVWTITLCNRDFWLINIIKNLPVTVYNKSWGLLRLGPFPCETPNTTVEGGLTYLLKNGLLFFKGSVEFTRQIGQPQTRSCNLYLHVTLYLGKFSMRPTEKLYQEMTGTLEYVL